MCRTILGIAALVGTAIAMFLTAPMLFLEPRLWAEEGTVYLAYACSHPWLATLSSSHMGYYSLWANAASAVAGHVAPLGYAPLATTLFAAVAQLIPIAIIAWSRSSFWSEWWRKLVGIGIVLVAPLTGELWLNTINSQFYFSLVCALILLEEVPKHWVRRIVYRLLMTLAGLSGAVSCFLLPAFLCQYVIEKTKERAIQTGVLGVCAVVQGVAIFRAAETLSQ